MGKISIKITNSNYTEIVESIKRGKCPFCNETMAPVSGVIAHIQATHHIDGCPVCVDGRYRSLKHHIAKKKDILHTLTYAIFFKRGRSRKISKIRGELFGEEE